MIENIKNYKTKEALEIELQRRVAARKEMLAEREEYLRSLQQPQENTAKEAPTEKKESTRATQQPQENMSQETSQKKKTNLFNKLVKQKLWNKIFSR